MGTAIPSSVDSYVPTTTAVLGLNPKHTIHAFSIYSQILYYICHCIEKRMKVNKKGLGLAHSMTHPNKINKGTLNIIFTMFKLVQPFWANSLLAGVSDEKQRSGQSYKARYDHNL